MKLKFFKVFVLLTCINLNSFAPVGPGIKELTEKKIKSRHSRIYHRAVFACMAGAAAALISRLGFLVGQASCK